VTEVVAQDGKGPQEGPVVRVQLGRGHIHLGEECALEPRERQLELDLLENGGIHEEKGYDSGNPENRDS